MDIWIVMKVDKCTSLYLVDLGEGIFFFYFYIGGAFLKV